MWDGRTVDGTILESNLGRTGRSRDRAIGRRQRDFILRDTYEVVDGDSDAYRVG